MLFVVCYGAMRAPPTSAAIAVRVATVIARNGASVQICDAATGAVICDYNNANGARYDR